MPRRFGDYAWTPRTLKSEILYGAVSAGLLGTAIAIGWQQGMLWQTFPLLGTSIALEAQPGAAASVALGFLPIPGAAISVLGNLIFIPIMLIASRQVLSRWPWARRKLSQARRFSERYGKYGVGVLFVLAPFLGTYVSIAIGYAMGARPIPTLATTLAGMITSVLLIVYGGQFILHLF